MSRLRNRFGMLAVTMAVLLVAGSFSFDLLPSSHAFERLAPARDWPQWRGPNRDGISAETGFLAEWKDAPALLWKKSELGRGYASVAVVGDTLYTAGKVKDISYGYALNEADGSVKWSVPIGEPKDENPRATPTVDGDRVYFLGAEGDLLCVDRASGKPVWSKDFAADFGGKMMSGWKFCESPLIDGDRLVCTPGGKEALVVCLNKLTGETIWKSPLPDVGKSGKDGAGYSSIVISHAAGVKQYVQIIGRGCIGIAAEDGRFLWAYNRVANQTANIPTPIIDGDFVFCSTGYGTGAALLKLSKEGSGVKAEEQYFLPGKDLQNHHGGMIKIGDYVYMGHGHNRGYPTCVEMKTGKIVWRQETDIPGSGSAAIVFAEGKLYFRYQNGVVALIDAKPEGYAFHGQLQIPDAGNDSWPHPVVCHGKLFLREHDTLYVYDIARKDGQ